MEIKDKSLFTEVDEQEATQVSGGNAYTQVMGLIRGIRRNPNNPLLNGSAAGSAHRYGVYSPLTGGLFGPPYPYIWGNPRR